jgi:hypothetical protein
MQLGRLPFFFELPLSSIMAASRRIARAPVLCPDIPTSLVLDCCQYTSHRANNNLVIVRST